MEEETQSNQKLCLYSKYKINQSIYRTIKNRSFNSSTIEIQLGDIELENLGSNLLEENVGRISIVNYLIVLF